MILLQGLVVERSWLDLRDAGQGRRYQFPVRRSQAVCWRLTMAEHLLQDRCGSTAFVRSVLLRCPVRAKSKVQRPASNK